MTTTHASHALVAELVRGGVSQSIASRASQRIGEMSGQQSSQSIAGRIRPPPHRSVGRYICTPDRCVGAERMWQSRAKPEVPASAL